MPCGALDASGLRIVGLASVANASSSTGPATAGRASDAPQGAFSIAEAVPNETSSPSNHIRKTTAGKKNIGLVNILPVHLPVSSAGSAWRWMEEEGRET